MAEDNDSERTEAASPQRIEKAREEGQVARSHELTTFAMLMAGACGLWLLGADLFRQLGAMLQQGLILDVTAASDATQMMSRMHDLALMALLAMAPLLAMLLVVAFAAPQFLSGWVFGTNTLRIDLQRLDPLAGLMRVLSWRGLSELVKALVKSALIAIVATATLWHYREPLLELVLLPPATAISEMARLVGLSFMIIGGTLAIVAAIDVPFQLWRHANDLKMSLQELRQEHKESEGNPEIKAAIRSQQREMARRRMMSEVPKASVIVTNPTHYAVALSYEDDTMRAPCVVAKGADLLAARIKEIAEDHHIPVLESPALARAIYRHADIGDEIPETLYNAVAEILAYVFQLRRHREFGDVIPLPLRLIAVPAGLDPQEAV